MESYIEIYYATAYYFTDKKFPCFQIIFLRDTAWVEISCFHDYGQELDLSLLYYLKIGKTRREK